jgi:hypothetical protein
LRLLCGSGCSQPLRVQLGQPAASYAGKRFIKAHFIFIAIISIKIIKVIIIINVFFIASLSAVLDLGTEFFPSYLH